MSPLPNKRRRERKRKMEMQGAIVRRLSNEPAWQSDAMPAIAGYSNITRCHTNANTAADVSFSQEQKTYNSTDDDDDEACREWDLEPACREWDPQLEAACWEWVQEVTGVAFADGSSLQEELKSGVMLCQLCNAIRPGVCTEPSTMSVPCKEALPQQMEARMQTLASYFTSCDVIGVPKDRQLKTATLYQNNTSPSRTSRIFFTHLENIDRYLAACSVLGVPRQHLFQTAALYENRDIMQVLNNLQALGRAAQREPNYKGPPFG